MNKIINNKKIKQEQTLIPKSIRLACDQFEFIFVKQQVVVNSRRQLYLWVAWFRHGFTIAPDNSVQNALQL